MPTEIKEEVHEDVPTDTKKSMRNIALGAEYYERDRDPDVEDKIVNAPETGKAWIDFDPIWDMSDDQLEELFAESDKKTKTRNFLTYVTGSESLRKEMKVRVNCKYQAYWTRQ